MAKQLLCILIFMSAAVSFSQNNFWKNEKLDRLNSVPKPQVSTPIKYRTVVLDTQSFLDFASGAKRRFSDNESNTLTLVLPLPNGKNETFTLEDSELMHPDLAEKFPELKTYSGKGITDKTAILRLSYSPYFGLSGMILSGKHSTVYIDPITTDNRYYMSYYRNDLSQMAIDFECSTEELTMNSMKNFNGNSERVAALGDCNLRRYRLAQSCTGEYAQYHIGQAGGTTGTMSGDKAIVQAAMNVTMNRVNGIYERDLGITMQFVPNNDLVIYLNPSTDPWTNEWNTRTAQTLDTQIGVFNYDIGHNFNTTGGGNAGCLDCVCLSVSQNNIHKGRGFTGLSAPVGDPFDIDYVAHEMGHQFGGYHVQSNNSCRSGSGMTEVEVGSGSTIMGYAGICSVNVQNNSDDYFAYVNIRDIVTSINYGNASGCAELMPSGNSGPNADAGPNYAIPRSTPFRLDGVGSDPDDTGLTYCWEQNDPENPNSNSAPISTRALGPMFRSLPPVSVSYRYMPNINAIVNNTTPTFEVLPSISRSMDFSFIVRDNNSSSGCTASDLMTVTTVGSAGPFIVTAPNTNVTWASGSTQTVTWNVAGTTAAPISCTNVDILLSIDGGYTYPITILANTPNDGSQAITVPNNPGFQNRIMIKASNNIFFDISNTNFTISGPCVANTPTELAASNIGETYATLDWNEVYSTTYDVRYREVSSSTWLTIPVSNLSVVLSDLYPLTDYEAQVRSKCGTSTTSAYSDSIYFTTTDWNYCNSNGNDTSDEFIGRVQLNTLDNNSGPGTSGTGYSNFASNPSLTTDLVAGTQYTITITPFWTGNVYSEGYSVWIDYNYDGDFDDTGEQVWTRTATTNSPVSGIFTVPEDVHYGPTRMRVSMKYNGIPTSCESFSYGEVEDYTVNLMYDGLLFTKNAWTPNAPSALTSGDNALVLDGTFNLNDNVALNNLTINSGATMNVLQGQSVELNGNLTSNGSFILNSSSNQYASLIPNGTVSGNVAYRRHVNINASSGGNDLISAPLTGQTFGAFAMANTNIVSNPNNTSEKLFGPFDKATGTYLTYDTDVPTEASSVLSAGIGYRAASTDDGTFEFTGTVNTGVVNANIQNTGPAYAEWNLIGNPYPSYIKLSDFLNANINEFLPSSAAIYGYDGNAADGWKILNLAYSMANPNTIITPGQGYLVSSKIGGGTMVFNPSFRTIASGNAILDDDFIEGREADSNDIAHLSLSMTSNSSNSQTDFYFTNNATRGLDIGYDAVVFNGVASNYAIFSHLVEDSAGDDMAIQTFGFEDLDNSLEVPLGVNAAQGQQITIGMSNNTLPNDVEVYIEDRLNNTFVLLNDGDYNFTTANDLLGIGRFFLRFEASTLGMEDNELNQLLIYATSTPRQIVVKGLVSESTKAMVYDIQGRHIMTLPLSEGVAIQTIDASRLSSGIYAVKLQGKSNHSSRKIVIK